MSHYRAPMQTPRKSAKKVATEIVWRWKHLIIHRTPPPQGAPILCGKMQTVTRTFTRCRRISTSVQALDLDAGNLAVLRQACGELAAAKNGLRQNRAY
jgi:hypothetical protein